jgi:hypothetical protein
MQRRAAEQSTPLDPGLIAVVEALARAAARADHAAEQDRIAKPAK